MKYFIRKEWDDVKSQIGDSFTNLNEAMDKCIYPYKIYNENAFAVIETGIVNISNSNSTICRIDYENMWNKLKEKIQNKVELIDKKKCITTAEEVTKLFYQELLINMEKIETEETKILEDK